MDGGAVTVLPFTPPERPFLDVVNTLAQKLAKQQPTLRALDAYYEGRASGVRRAGRAQADR